MNCKMYEQFELGKITEERFNKHLKICTKCQQNQYKDGIILAEVKKLKYKIDAPDLWQRISHDLENEDQNRSGILYLKKMLFGFLPTQVVAASLTILVVLGVFLLLFTSGTGTILNENALDKVQKLEREYIMAISELEREVYPKIEKINLELSLRYKDRLQVIDEQIQICKEELKNNSANTHIRHYLLAALKDKKDTLIAMNQF